ncbi:hypothetical protein BJY01DRAFT_196600 [Aspergillus pseudoustus]|uniref:Chromosome segregation protein BIR1 n=1 Tax=Aspergillus pseudoustus TaxID=1810923 RepID=A0ABR4KUG7_9EURO
MANDMETFAARLATFDLVLQPDRRSSSSKSAKPISWPHISPSPAELANAGFFYNPYETNPDNTTCFLCRRALDGWEEDDNPITEHLKHTKDCGWAVMMDIYRSSSNPAEIDDPTSEKIAGARLATFGESWPHDGKKGWLCQSGKMVDGGWYFCPNEESADMASCAYCKLSLDCWEPKDNPFDEHYRRSPDCSFFVFAKPARGKGSRSKKGRTSKASRLSTQSTASEIAASDIEDQMDESLLAPPAKAKAGKKSSKSKAKSTKSKKDEGQDGANRMEVDEADYTQPEPPKPKRSARGTKRSSADFEKDNVGIVDGDSVNLPEPPTKKRATKLRTSRARSQSVVSTDAPFDAHGYESDATQHEEQRTSRTSKKKTSKSRKASVSSTSKSTSKSRVPRDSELDAAIEAGLETDESQKMEIEETNIEKTPPKPSKKSKSKKKATKKDPEPPADIDARVSEDEVHATYRPDVQHKTKQDGDLTANQESKETEEKGKRWSMRKSVEQPQTKRTSAALEKSTAQMDDDEDDHHHDSFISVEIVSKPPAEYSVLEPTDKDSKKPKKKASSEKPKKSKKAATAEKSDKSEKAETTTKPEKAEEKLQKRHSEENEIAEQQSPLPARLSTPEPSKLEHTEEESSRRSSKVPPKTAERYSDISHEKQYAKSLVESQGSETVEDKRRTSRNDGEDEPVSPLPPASRGTPSLSPQSSDAENRPPSTNFSAARPQVSSPSKRSHVRIPLADSTPSPSKRNASAGRVQTSHPWVPIDIDEMVLASASDKENVDLTGALSNTKNDLPSPEKKMTVEEWIMWNAKNGEERLKRECERLVGQFEREGARAMRALEGIECID